MEAGARVWCTDTDGDQAWLFAEVVKKEDTIIHLFQVDKPANKFSRPINTEAAAIGEIKYKGVELANAKLSDEEKAEGLDDDLITLPHLHEPALLHAVSERFFDGKIYTWTGPVLIAVNPFQRLPLYTTVRLEFRFKQSSPASKQEYRCFLSHTCFKMSNIFLSLLCFSPPLSSLAALDHSLLRAIHFCNSTMTTTS
jgi:myosin heavy subunit